MVQTQTTYIIKTSSHEFYCGKTNNFTRRLTEHMKEDNKHWFGIGKDRKTLRAYIVFKGDYEKQIKRAGVKLIFDLAVNILDERYEVSAP